MDLKNIGCQSGSIMKMLVHGSNFHDDYDDNDDGDDDDKSWQA